MKKTILFLTIAVLNINYVYGDTLYAKNTAITCDDTPSQMYGLYLYPGEYTCASGYFLPADGDECVACPNGTLCMGGNYRFNANESQGLVFNETLPTTTMNNVCADNFPTNLYAKYRLSEFVCASGYYLPADAEGCVACPNGYTCAGGTFLFNANIDQGIAVNTITIVWNGASAEDIAANNAGTTTYGGDIRTPRAAMPIPGKIFRGWKFSKPLQD